MLLMLIVVDGQEPFLIHIPVGGFIAVKEFMDSLQAPRCHNLIEPKYF